MNNSAFMENLRQLFGECDRDQSGSLGPDEFKMLCEKIGLSKEMADETFKRLDIDQNSQITFEEFAAGFNKYTQQQQKQHQQQPPAAPPTPAKQSTVAQQPGAASPRTGTPHVHHPNQASRASTTSSPVTRRAQSRASPSNNGAAVSLGSTGSSSNLTMSGRSTSSSTGAQIEHCLSSTDLYSSCELAAKAGVDQQQQKAAGANNDVIVYSSDLIDDNYADQANSSSQFGSFMSSSGSFNQLKTMQDLLECVQKLQNENQILTQIFFKDKREREEYISQLGEEFDQQLREVEERANRRAKEELELEKKRLREMMQAERETLQHHYQTLEKMSKLVKSSSNGMPNDGDGISKVKSQLEDTFMENRQLKKSLMDTKTDVALIWKEMEKLKKQYEAKLSNAYEKQRETQHECDHIKLQLNLMKDSNRKLQDASDVITNYITDKVEPVIKVAMEPSDDPNGDNSLGGPNNSSSRSINQSASNSRRGSILSEYLNNNNNDDDDEEGRSAYDLESMASSLGASETSRQTTKQHQLQQPAPTSGPPASNLLKRMNGLETSLSRNQRFNQSTTSSSTTASDNHLLVVPPPEQPLSAAASSNTPDAQDSNNSRGSPDKQTTPIKAQADSSTTSSEHTTQAASGTRNAKVSNDTIESKQWCNHTARWPGSSVLNRPGFAVQHRCQQINKYAGSDTNQKSGFKNIGRHFGLGGRSQSDAKPKEPNELTEAKSMSADHADEPSVEPTDGPSVATFNIILVGDSFVGKSSFAARFIEGNFVQGLISNCSIDFKTKTYKVDGVNYTVNLWDTA
jgi:hypothetical protein